MAATADLRLWRLFGDAKEDCGLVVYALVVLSPLCSLLVRYLTNASPKSTPWKVFGWGILLPMVVMGMPLAYMYQYGEVNIYDMLQVTRNQSAYQIAIRYTKLKETYRRGEMSPEFWSSIDAAYDQIYGEKPRQQYDFWGRDNANMTPSETVGNVGLFYLLWWIIIYALTTPKSAERASTWCYCFWIVLGGFELCVRILKYDPWWLETLSETRTPRELVLWCHRVLPILVFATVTIKKTLYADLESYRHEYLLAMKERNQRIWNNLLQVHEHWLQQDHVSDDHNDADVEQLQECTSKDKSKPKAKPKPKAMPTQAPAPPIKSRRRKQAPKSTPGTTGC